VVQRPEPPEPAEPPTHQDQANTELSGVSVAEEFAGEPEPSVEGVPPADATLRKAWLAKRLSEIFSHLLKKNPSIRLSLFVVEPASGEVLFSRTPDEPVNAASNVKLVTISTALSLLGPGYRFRTRLAATPDSLSTVQGRTVLRSDLYVAMGGDPFLQLEHLQKLTDQLRALNIKRIEGDLVIDDSHFDASTMPPAFEQKNESGSFRAPSSAASLQGNSVSVTVGPALRPSRKAGVVVRPSTDYLQTEGRIVTARRGGWPRIETAEFPPNTSNEDFEVSRTLENQQTRILLAGGIAAGSRPITLRRRIAHPAAFVAHAFGDILARNRIQFAGNLRLGTTPDNAVVLAEHHSMTLGAAARSLGKYSDNFVAEQLLRELGGVHSGFPGTWEKGQRAVREYLTTLGIEAGTYRMDNGSGLYDSNRFTARQLTRVIRATLSDFRIASDFLSSLSIAGVDGTLTRRMVDSAAQGYVRAKTGTLKGASSLSGIVGSQGSVKVAFSFLMNAVTDRSSARTAQDLAAIALAQFARIQAETQGQENRPPHPQLPATTHQP